MLRLQHRCSAYLWGDAYIVTTDCGRFFRVRGSSGQVPKSPVHIAIRSPYTPTSVGKRNLCAVAPFFRSGLLGLAAVPPRSRKEVFQPHLPVRLPCYDLAPVTCLTLGRSFRSRTSGTPGSHGLTGGVYKARERIHRAVADARLLANPASWSRVADSNPN